MDESWRDQSTSYSEEKWQRTWSSPVKAPVTHQASTYSQKVGKTLSGHPVKVLAAYGRQEVVEGPEVEGVVILEFPSFEAAKAWYDSPAYREVREHRFRGPTIAE